MLIDIVDQYRSPQDSSSTAPGQFVAPLVGSGRPCEKGRFCRKVTFAGSRSARAHCFSIEVASPSTNARNTLERPSQFLGSPYLPFTLQTGSRRRGSSGWLPSLNARTSLIHRDFSQRSIRDCC